jgi:hypothetical protein
MHYRGCSQRLSKHDGKENGMGSHDFAIPAMYKGDIKYESNLVSVANIRRIAKDFFLANPDAASSFDLAQTQYVSCWGINLPGYYLSAQENLQGRIY